MTRRDDNMIDTNLSKTYDYSLWADTGAGAIRTIFGLIWACDAYLKWQPGFFNNYLSYITDIASGQPHWLLPWFNFWSSLIKPEPSLFAWLTRLIETAIAVGLLLGLGRKWIYVLGSVFALFIWSIPEGFGGPYTAGATDVGAGLIYILVFIALIIMDYTLGRSPYSLDYYMEKKFPSWRLVAEWAHPNVLAKEPRRLSWLLQIGVILGALLMLVIFLIIIQSELNAAATAPTQTSILNTIQMVLFRRLWF
jgi:nitrite reductase (NO-forming)